MEQTIISVLIRALYGELLANELPTTSTCGAMDLSFSANRTSYSHHQNVCSSMSSLFSGSRKMTPLGI